MLTPEANIVILTGAGMSAESGIATFRAADGLWEGHRIEDVASPQGFERDPARVHAFYNQRRAQLKEVKPNAGHEALARLEQQWRGDFLLVTQNVDDLHERAGSRRLVHMHGELLKARCEECCAILGWSGELTCGSRCRACGAIGSLRPQIVWFGEYPLEMERIMAALINADWFVSIGTSGVVYPAAGFALQAAGNGKCHLIEVNINATETSRHFHQSLMGPATTEVPKLVDDLLARLSLR